MKEIMIQADVENTGMGKKAGEQKTIVNHLCSVFSFPGLESEGKVNV
jgi:hypothetical protein